MEATALKKSVSVSENSDCLFLDYGFNQISIPKNGDYDAVVSSIIDKTFPAQKERYSTDELSLVEYLSSLGCLSYKVNETLSLREAKEIFDSIRMRWYGEYYSHPLWNMLRKGEINKNGLVAWLIHNYHVSRSAGMTDARFYSRTKNLKLKQAYKESCLEEYSHCDEFYFVEHPSLNINDEDVRAYVHLPGSLAFDQQMLRMSEDCWLGHLFVSYFQEATVSYYSDCISFYADVEKAYDIKDFFNRWKQHVELDLEYSHFEHFEDIFSDKEIISRDFLLFALNQAWITYKHLYYSLDQIIDESKKSDAIYMRLPIKDGEVNKSSTSLLFPYLIPDSKIGLVENSLDVFKQIEHLGFFKNSKSISLSENDRSFIRFEIKELIIKSLGYSKSHYITICLGDLLKLNDFSIAEKDQMCFSPDVMAVSNFLNELTYRPNYFLFAVYTLLHTSLSIELDLEQSSAFVISKYLQRWALGAQAEMDDLTTIVLQLNEFVENVANTKEYFIAEDELN